MVLTNISVSILFKVRIWAKENRMFFVAFNGKYVFKNILLIKIKSLFLESRIKLTNLNLITLLKSKVVLLQ